MKKYKEEQARIAREEEERKKAEEEAEKKRLADIEAEKKKIAKAEANACKKERKKLRQTAKGIFIGITSVDIDRGIFVRFISDFFWGASVIIVWPTLLSENSYLQVPYH